MPGVLGRLGGDVVGSLATLNIPLGIDAGTAVVIIAIYLDRVSARFGNPQRHRPPGRRTRKKTEPSGQDPTTEPTLEELLERYATLRDTMLGLELERDALGAQIKAALEQQFDNPSPGGNRILQVSQGFAYTWDNAKPRGEKVSGITLNGQPIDPAANYRVTVNNFLADGGDGFTVFAQGKDRLGGDLDIDAFQNYLKANTVTPGPLNRITRLN